ncbi:hypothetical protein GUJ93_ZPchr0013g37810 [Zizania palustris]|uniref:Uncharacterized protein n=1 Tax=Zizania palustris TaxID=103762 RepID=A0A8J5WT14_ZIZPA|nr:hypothetical protein GUJ93_ZPchr0013g37810 [Zizania palustris]
MIQRKGAKPTLREVVKEDDNSGRVLLQGQLEALQTQPRSYHGFYALSLLESSSEPSGDGGALGSGCS